VANLLVDAVGLGGDVDRSLSLPLAPFGRALIDRLGPLNLWTALLLAGALGVDRLLSRRVRASWRIALYAPLLLRLAVPLDWNLHTADTSRIEMVFAPLLAVSGAGQGTTLAHDATWLELAALLYFAVAAMLAARIVLAHRRLAGALVTAARVDRDLRAPCPVLEHAHLGPMVVGFQEPRIVVPRVLLAPENSATLACVLRHEAAHLGRRDVWLTMTLSALTVVVWPVLPVWIAARRVRHLMELACDESAIRGCDATERRHYGHALLDCAELHAFGPALGAGELHFGSTLRARIEAIGAQRHWPRALQAILVPAAAVALFVACGGSGVNAMRGTAQGPARCDDGGPPGYGYEFATDTVEKVTNAPAPPTDRPLAECGRLRPEAIEDVVRGHFGAALRCYENRREANTVLGGVVKVRFVIQENGYVREVASEGSTVPDENVVHCILDDFRKRHFPPSHDGDVTVLYPIQLGS
jgi:hypothetical protein